MDPEKRGAVLDQLKILSLEMVSLSQTVRTHNRTRKTQGKIYPIPTGYATAVRRPIRDLLKWMDNVEESIYLIVDLLESEK